MKPQTFAVLATLTTLSFVYLARLNESAGRAGKNDQAPSSAVSVQNDVQSEPLQSITAESAVEKMPRLRTTSSSFRISVASDTIVYAKRGTGLYFPADIFVRKDGSSPSGSVRVVVEECYDLPEILAAKLSTTSNGRLLETAGMIHIRAFADKEELSIREGGRYQIYFPNQHVHADDFHLFYGQRDARGIINWELASDEDQLLIPVESTRQALANGAVSIPDDSFNQECIIQITESYLRRGTKISQMDYFNWQLSNGQTLNQWFISGFNPDITMVKDFCSKGLRSEISFKVNKEGAFDSYFIAHSDFLDYDRKIADFLRTMPPLDLEQLMPEFTSDHACRLTFSSHENSMPENFVASFRKRNITDPDKNFENISASDMDYYVFASSELGWINCDRFVEPEESLQEYVVENPGSSSSSVSMVFSDINSVLKGVVEGDKVVFEEVPKGKEVRLICIDNQGKTPVMSVVACNTSQKSPPDFPSLKPFNEKQLRREFTPDKSRTM